MRAVRAAGVGWTGGGGGGERSAGGGWAWTRARKTLLFMAGALRWGAVRAVWAVWAVWAVRAVRAVRAAGVGHGLEPVKHCFSWQRRWGQ